MSLLKADPSQFQLTDTGNILYQKALNNPTLGELVAKIVKGDNIYNPAIELVECDHVKMAGEEDAKQALSKWLSTHIETVLEPLKRLETTDVLRKKEDSDELEPVEFSQQAKDNAKAVMDRLHDAMGVIHRADIATEIQALDEEARKILRAKRIKLGPILVFLPELNKPKGVRLRGLLWSLWNGFDLPAELPSDGAVSVKVDSEAVNKDLYFAVGYPVYGPRAIRIDMLDRVINSIYEHAKDGKFQAQHAMAEWLGCSIEDLYAVLSAMGHKHIEPKADETVAEKSDLPMEVDVKETAAEPVDEKALETAKEKTEPQKPALDMFWLKKGQAHKSNAARPNFKKKQDSNKDKPDFKKNKKKPFKKSERKPVVMKAEAETRPEDNPFAVLEQLKSK